MKGKLYNLGLLLTSLVGYHEWGGGNSAFLFEMERDLIASFAADPLATLHPFTLLPLLGQSLLLLSLFQREPGRRISLIGILCLSVLLFLMFLIGLVDLNVKSIITFLPYVLLALVAFRYHWRRKQVVRVD